jgi:hypothetical protein
MSIQILPVAQIGYALGANTWTEELPHAEDGSKADVESMFAKKFITITNHSFNPVFSLMRQEIYIHTSDSIPSNHSTDVVTPPPDAVA